MECKEVLFERDGEFYWSQNHSYGISMSNFGFSSMRDYAKVDINLTMLGKERIFASIPNVSQMTMELCGENPCMFSSVNF